ncbi:MAG: MraY family glycosyltransferase [Patescibacteria group bacterium]
MNSFDSLLIGGTFLVALITTPLLARLFVARRLALVAPKRTRDVHTRPIPRLGGLIIAVIFWIAIAIVLLFDPSRLEFSRATVWGIDRNLFGLLLGSVILVTVGVLDDLFDLKPSWKLLGQLGAAAMVPLFGIEVQRLTNPLGGPYLELSAAFDAAIAIGWIVLTINVMNFLDGLDGLATGVGSVALLTLASLAVAPFVGQPALAFLLLILLAASLGFLPSNWHPAKIFLGDSGSQLMGYLLGVAAIISGGKLATAALVLSLPILDALWAVIRRLATGQSPFVGDREHLHHRLLDLGISQPVVVLILMAVSGIFGLIALSSRTAGKVHAFAWAILLMVILLVALSLAERMIRKKERN